MDQGQDLNKKANEALNSFDGIQRAEPAPWFFTRLQARMAREQKTPWVKVSSFLSRPTVAIAGLFLVLTMNVIFLYTQNNKETIRSFANQPDQSLMSDNETIIASNSSFDYENLALP